jgi:hypothetical protein
VARRPQPNVDAELAALDMTGFGQYVNQQGGSALSPDPRAPLKWAVAHDAERIFDLGNKRALNAIDAARARQRRGRAYGRAVHDRGGADAVARRRSRREAAGMGAIDRPEHDARRPDYDDVLHGVLAVR